MKHGSWALRDAACVRLAALGLASIVGASCGGAPAPPPATPLAPAAVAIPDAPSAPPTAAAAAPPQAAAPERAPVRAADSAPPGVEPLGKDEESELASKCKPVSDFAAKAGGKARTRLEAMARTREALEHVPALAGVDVARCVALLRRSLSDYEARTVEGEAQVELKRIALGAATAFEQEPPRRCGAAPPVPANLATLASGPFTSRPEDWQSKGWQCLGFAVQSPQRFQYEVREIPGGQGLEAIARGFPVAGAPATELFLRVRPELGTAGLSSELMRR